MLSYFLLLTLLLTSTISSNTPDIINGVVQLTSENFEQYIQTHEHVFVKFYSPNCGHCKAMKSDYEQAAQVLVSEGVYFAEVDASVETYIQQKFEIRGFPTLKFFISGQSSEYSHGRSKDELIEWVRKKLGPAALDLVSTDDVEQAVNDNEVVVVYFGERSGEEYQVFERVGKRFEDIIFGIANEGEKFNIDKSVMPVIKMFKKFDEREVVFDRAMNSENEVYKWIDYHWNEKLYNFTYRTAEKIFSQQKPVLFLFLEFQNKEHQEFRKIAIELAEKLRGEILVSESQITEGMGERLAEFMEIQTEMLPAVRIMQMTDTETRRYVYNGEMNTEGVLQFYQQWKNNELKAVYKSEALPEDNDGKIIKKIVSVNFDEIVRDQNKNVVLMISAPWCKPCHEALPELEALVKGQLFEDLVVGVMDATENEVEGLIIEGFPCIKYYPKDTKYQNINFYGKRTKAGFEQFLKQYYETREENKVKNEGKQEMEKEEKKQQEIKETKKEQHDKDEL